MRYLFFILVSFFGMNAAAQDFRPILSDGKVWHCQYTYLGGAYAYTITIDGDTIVGDKACKKAVFEGTTDRGVAFNRTEACFEENGRLYSFDPENDETDDYTVPCLICDFNLNVGDPAWNGYVTKVDTIEVRGVQRRRITLDYSDLCVWVEGIGTYSDGWPTTRPIPTNGHTETVDSVCENRQVIFTKEDFFAPAITNSINPTENQMKQGGKKYDLTGKLVRKAKKNEIYIQDGKKRIDTSLN